MDYLQRGHEDLGLRGKLDNFLKSQEVEPSDYLYAYLVTAVRFLGYHFNLVSFWYLYSSDKVPSAMVLEVNNTHDERRPYLVLRDFAQEAKQVSDVTPAPGAAPSRMRGSWPKDFCVSPFSSRKGSYSPCKRPSWRYGRLPRSQRHHHLEVLKGTPEIGGAALL